MFPLACLIKCVLSKAEHLDISQTSALLLKEIDHNPVY